MRVGRYLVAGWIGLSWVWSAAAADLDTARQQYLSGNYQECLRAAERAVSENDYGEEWRWLLAECLITVGRYAEAAQAVTNGLARYPRSIRLRLQGFDVLRQNGKLPAAREHLQEINNLAGGRMWAYRDPANQVVLGKAALLLGADPRLVLDNFFERVKAAEPNFREVYVASGELALSKHDYALAAKVFEEGRGRFPKDAGMEYGLAAAFAPSDRAQMVQALESALKLNPNHIPSHLLLADHLIDGEEYETAEEMLGKALEVNPAHPETWAYRAVVAHLRGDRDGESNARRKALEVWETNPRVAQLIGQKLSQKYRFVEGAESQRQALAWDANYLPAKIQLAQDLLRLGEEDEGWRLAQEVHQRDGYDVTAFNLVTLKDSLARFKAVTNADFVVRMAPAEAAIYGERVLELLSRARTQLGRKYGLLPQSPTLVEIFPEQKDFAVRTFGMPGNPGFLGVCFGRLITANSPASQGSRPANWEAVLWHEFCHVITLQMTRNRMPRWLSEGISVYEERLANPAWGQGMTPAYRERLLKKNYTPVSQLSAVFLTAKNDQDVQFAYYHSSLVVEYLAQTYGTEKLQRILRDLRDDVEMNQALERHVAPIETIDQGFAEFARDRAKSFGPDLDWEKPVSDQLGIAEPEFLVKTSNNYHTLTRQAIKLVAEKNWPEAKPILEKLIRLCPEQTGSQNAYLLLAEAHRNLNETAAERDVLDRLAQRDGDALEAYQRLIELARANEDWTEMRRNAERFCAVNPLVAQPYRALAQANEALGRTGEAIAACRTLLLLDPPDPAELHFRLASLLRKQQDPAARRHVLQALEEAPRYRAAHRLLLEMERGAANPPAQPPPATAPEAGPKPNGKEPSSFQ